VIIAIDGHSSCGKSTLAKSLATELNYTYLDTGAMYRAVTLYFLENNVDYKNVAEVEEALNKILISFDSNSNHTLLNNKDVEEEIRGKLVSDHVSPVSTISEVRAALVKQQRIFGQSKNIIMDGRDIGTVVFPDAKLKLFVTADLKTRTIRRFEEMKRRGIAVSQAEVEENLVNRDRIDSTRADSPLSKASDAVLIDNSNLSREEQLAMCAALAKFRM